MGLRGTLVLALLVALGAAYLLYEGPPPEERPQLAESFGGGPTPAPTAAVVPLLEFAPDQISEVVLRRDGKELVSRRQAGGWTSASPASAMPDFLDNLTHLGELMHIEAGAAELREYGLESPQAEIELRRTAGEPLVLLLGDRNPSTTGAYVRVGRTGHVALAGALVWWEFDKAYKALGG